MALSDSITEMFSTLRGLTAQTVENYQSELSLIGAEQARLTKRAAAIEAALAEMGEAGSAPTSAPVKKAVSMPKAAPKPAPKAAPKTAAKPAAAKPAAKASAGGSAAGDAAIAYLRKHAGKFIPSKEIAAHIGDPKVGEAIKLSADAAKVERKGMGRRMEYRIKA